MKTMFELDGLVNITNKQLVMAYYLPHDYTIQIQYRCMFS